MPLSTNNRVTTGVSNMRRLVEKFVADEAGATAIEYGLIAALIALAIMAGATSLGSALNAKFEFIASKLSGAGTK